MKMSAEQSQSNVDMNELLKGSQSGSVDLKSTDIAPMTQEQCTLLIYGYTRSLDKVKAMQSDILRMCVSFYSIWFDLKLVYCDDKTGEFDLSEYEIKPVSIESNITLRDLATEIEDEIYAQSIQRLRTELMNKDDQELHRRSMFLNIDTSLIHMTDKDVIVNRILVGMFGVDGTNKFSKISSPCSPLVHIWIKFDRIKLIYPISTRIAKLTMEELIEHEGGDRWVEIPDDYMKTSLKDIQWKSSEFLVIEKMKLNLNEMLSNTFTFVEWYNTGDCIWPRAKGNDWRETMQTGDIVEVEDTTQKYYESLVRFVYPKDHKTMAGKCTIHYIGWNIKWDETMDIDSNRICKRYTHCFLPHRPRQKNRDPPPHVVQDDNFNVNAQNQEDIDLQRAIAASLGQI